MLNIRQFVNGLRIIPTTPLSLDRMGEIQINSVDGKLNYHDGTSISPMVTETSTATLTNKSINATSNTISEISDSNISLTAAIDASKIANGSVSNIEFQYLDGVTSSIQVQLNTIAGSAITALIGDVTGVGPGSTSTIISNNVVTNAKLAQMAAHTFKGNNTGISADPLDLTQAELTAEINNFIGDSGSGGTKGLVPAPSAGDASASKFLKADGNFSVVNALQLTSKSDNATYYLAFVGANSTATQDLDVGPLSYNPSTNTLTATTFVGDLTGNAATATTATTAGNVSGVVLPSHGGTGIANNDLATLTRVGNFAKTETLTNTTSVTYPTTGTLSTLDGVENLSNKTFTDAITQAQISTPSNPASGFDKLYFKADNNLYKLDSTGSESLVGGGGGSGGINFVGLNSSLQPTNLNDINAEASIGNWAAYADAAASSPVDMTGGSPTVAISRTTTSGEVLNGLASFKVVKDAANRQGEGVSVSMYIPPGYVTGIQSIKIPFKIISGSIVQGDVKLFIYDITNSKIITPDNNDIFGSQNITEATFRIDTNTTQIRVGFHFATTSTTAVTFTFDDVFVGNSSLLGAGPSIEDWKNDLTFSESAGWGTTTARDYRYQRVGDTMHVVGFFTLGTPAASQGEILLPTGYTIDTTKLSSNSLGTLVGTIIRLTSTSSVSTLDYRLFYDGSTNDRVYLCLVASGSNGFNKDNVSPQFGAGESVAFEFRIPLTNWTANSPAANSAVTKMSEVLAAGINVTSTPVALGEYRTYIKNSSSVAGTDDAPSQTSASIAADGMKIFSTPYSSAGTTGEPNRWEMFIGHNKYFAIRGYSSTGRVGNVIFDPKSFNSAAIAGVDFSYDNDLGVLFADAMDQSSSVTSRDIGKSTPINGSGGGYSQNAYFEVLVADSLVALQLLNSRSEIEVNTPSGWGAVDTYVRLFSVIKTQSGQDISLSNDSNKGTYFTINTSGVYGITYFGDYKSTGNLLGYITKNETVLNSDPGYLGANVISYFYCTVSNTTGFQTTIVTNLNAGDIIRPMTDTVSGGTFGSTAETKFRITRIS